MSQAEVKNTPLMEQYFAVKNLYPDMLLFFQVGDFYELFFEDAKKAAAFLAITLTKRGKNKGEDIPLCGIPVHALNHYLKKLINGGFTVALCSQLEKAQPGVMVKRGVTHIFTPGTLTDQQFLDEKTASYLLTCYPGADRWALIFTELLTAQLFATTIPAQSQVILDAELARFFPDEIVLPGQYKQQASLFKKQGYYVTVLDVNDPGMQHEPALWVEQQFSSKVQMHLQGTPVLGNALHTLYWYLSRYQSSALQNFKNIQFYAYDDFLMLDAATQRNLEIVCNNQDNTRKNTLLAVLDKAKTAMGSRTIKKWLQRPLVAKQDILQRQQLVAAFVSAVSLQQELEHYLLQFPDLERIIGRMGLQKATASDYLALKKALFLVVPVKELLSTLLINDLSKALYEKIVALPEVCELLEASLNDDAESDYLIKPGFDLHLDYLRDLVTNSQQALIKLEQQEIARTGIASLKVRYNSISGYYIEITNTHAALVPSDYQHQQTLVNRKRFVTQELKDLERDIMKAHQEINGLQNEVFDRVKQDVSQHIAILRQMAHAFAYLDGLFGFALAAYEQNYVAPFFSDENSLAITDGRHPVVELQVGRSFISNDTMLNNDASLMIITGPNMGGKSTYLRQVPLIAIMAQCGSFVPAKKAILPIIDRIFTRIGSGDNVAEGKSTFLVEMEEAAIICTQATARSLVILDEVGRGTSTFDGMALAQAIIEYIIQFIGSKCLFATHYHELTRLAEVFSVVKNYHMMCHKKGHVLHFMHKLEPGVAHQSFGLDVARLARMPESIVVRASEILFQLQETKESLPIEYKEEISLPVSLKDNKQSQLGDEIIAKLCGLDIDDLTPRQALELLWSLKSFCKDK